jgi:isoleucyl-tRNA synthetase
MPGLERWVLHRLAEPRCTGDPRRLQCLRLQARDELCCINFASVDLSAVYFDIRKDSLYCDPRFRN